jgi:hypothetical protein
VTIENCGHYTFQEAFDRTGRIINITVAPVNNFDPPRLLNYLTAPHVCVWSAAVASCAIPGVFKPVPLIVREPDGKYAEEHVWARHGALPALLLCPSSLLISVYRRRRRRVRGHGSEPRREVQ